MSLVGKESKFKKSKFGMIPDTWDEKPIGKFAKTSSGGTPKRNNREFYEGGTINWFKTGELVTKYLYNSEEKITEKALKASSAKLFPKETLLVAMYGATIGKMSILKKESATNQACCAILPNENYDTEYLYYQLSFLRNKLINRGAGGAQPNISQDIIQTFPVPLPNRNEQQQIALILSTWDKAIELKEKLIEQKKELKKGLMQKLLTGEVRLSKNNENWKEEELEKVLENIVGGGTPSRKNPNYYNGEIPWATVKDMGDENYKDSTIEYISLEGLKNSSAKLIEKNNLIISTRMGLGRCFINTVDMAINQDLKGLYPKKSKILVEYLMYYFKLKGEDLEKNGSGSTVKGITLSVLKKLKIYYPNLETQQKIVNILSTVDKEIELLTEEVNQLKKQKKGLMQLLLTGKVRVKV